MPAFITWAWSRALSGDSGTVSACACIHNTKVFFNLLPPLPKVLQGQALSKVCIAKLQFSLNSAGGKKLTILLRTVSANRAGSCASAAVGSHIGRIFTCAELQSWHSMRSRCQGSHWMVQAGLRGFVGYEMQICNEMNTVTSHEADCETHCF